MVGTTSCNFVSPQTTTEIYEASDGTNFSVGDIKARNALIVSEDGEHGSLLVTFINDSGEEQDVTVQYDTVAGGSTERQTSTVTLDRGLTIFDSGENETFVMENLDDAMPGGLYPVYFQYGDAEGIEVQVPILGTELQEYSTLAPTPTSTPENTPTPSEGTESTPESTPEVTPESSPEATPESTPEAE
ncbi:hypothetical protein ACFDTO_20590 [Microbacteriaceae bacterium 4G12]